jgi:hypothetical protein
MEHEEELESTQEESGQSPTGAHLGEVRAVGGMYKDWFVE